MNDVLTISETCRMTGACYRTLTRKIKLSGIDPVQTGSLIKHYDRKTILMIAENRIEQLAITREDLDFSKLDTCIACGRKDYGNKAALRRGRCFSCFCRDYLAKHRIN